MTKPMVGILAGGVPGLIDFEPPSGLGRLVRKGAPILGGVVCVAGTLIIVLGRR